MVDTTSPRVVVFMGVIGSGKDFRANHLVQHEGYARVDFKDALLDLASDVAGYDVRADYDWFKAHVVGVKRPANGFLATYEGVDRDRMLTAHPDLMTGRRLLQRLGSEGMRKRDADHWVKAYLARARDLLLAGRRVVTADCRFHNEVRAVLLLDHAARFIFCDFHSNRYNPAAPHQSEAMAQALLARGYANGQDISEEVRDFYAPL